MAEYWKVTAQRQADELAELQALLRSERRSRTALAVIAVGGWLLLVGALAAGGAV